MNLSYLKYASAKLLAREGRLPLTAALDGAGQAPDGALTVYWRVITGGTIEPVTGAQINGTEVQLHGTLPALVVEEQAKSVLRQFQEILAGDLIVDLAPDAVVTLGPGQGQSGVVPLRSLALLGPRFELPANPGVLYAPATVGEKLGALWSVSVQGVPVSNTLLLRRST